MSKLFSEIARGAGTLPDCGSHPGTGFVILLTLITGLAGLQAGGLLGFVCGSGLGALAYGSMWLCGCVSRARYQDRLDAKALAKEVAHAGQS